MGMEIHDRWYASENRYLAFESENFAYAISIEHIKDIIAMGAGTPYEILPQAPEHVKCMVKVGGRILTVAELQMTSNDVLGERNQIIVLNDADKDIGILARNIHLIDVSIPEASVDEVIKEKKFVYDETGRIYLVFDISQCDKYVGA